jgi:hypothetical protein
MQVPGSDRSIAWSILQKVFNVGEHWAKQIEPLAHTSFRAPQAGDSP